MATLIDFVVSAEEFPFGELFTALPDVSVELDRVVPTNGALFPYVWISGGDHADIEAALEPSGATFVPQTVTLVDELEDRGSLYRVTWDPEPTGLIEIISDSGATMVSAVGARGQWTFTLRFDEHAEIGAFQNRCRTTDIHLSLSRLQPLGYAARDRELTPAQLEALELAYRCGYFDDSRRVTLDDLASEVGISRQSVAGRLRRGHRNLLAGLFSSSERTVGGVTSSAEE
ncbi:bacterio-opsin activator [Natrarchaeobius halalkaliphilus]|uniref:Bacterio-opsin activator n=1 Tax=Natrarchaeobius halalkaliphilus TaxID=1679091 RepID=A0A3N6LYJ7_9EURY|nr:helix-turn-helix domain-containing protein [Natrarchaeobius halalkaliphilus]RQG92944.1 bacterio-opsin activator [Natrarchaeobius halalkaliphilus]